MVEAGEDLDLMVNGAASFEAHIREHLDTPPKAFLQVRGRHLQQGSERSATDFDILIDCTVNIVAGQVDTQLKGASETKKVILSSFDTSTSRGDSEGRTSNMESLSSICEAILAAPAAERHLVLLKDMNTFDELSIDRVKQQISTMARYAGTIDVRASTSDSLENIALDVPSSAASDSQPREPFVTFRRQWTIQWPLAGDVGGQQGPGRASLPSSPNVVLRDSSNMAWRAKLPKAMLAGHVGPLRLEDPLPNDNVSMIKAIQERTKCNSNAVSDSSGGGSVTMRNVELGTWGGDG